MNAPAHKVSSILLSMALLASLTSCVYDLSRPDTYPSHECRARIYRDLPGVGERVTEEWQAYTFSQWTVAEAIVDCADRLVAYIDDYMAPGFNWQYEDFSVAPADKPRAGCDVPDDWLDNYGAPVGSELRWNDPPQIGGNSYVYLVDKDGEERQANPDIKSARIQLAARTGYPNPTGPYEVGKRHLRFSEIYIELEPFDLGDIHVDRLYIQSLGTILADYDGNKFKFTTPLRLFMRGLAEGETSDHCISELILEDATFSGTYYAGRPNARFTAGLDVPILDLGPEGYVQLSLQLPIGPVHAPFETHQPTVSFWTPKLAPLVGTQATLLVDNPFDHDSDIVKYMWFKDYERPTEVFLGTGNPATVTISEGQHEITVLAYDARGSYASATASFDVYKPDLAPRATHDSYTDAGANLDYVKAAPGVLENDYDPDGDALTAELLTDAIFGTVTLSSDGGFTYSPDPGFAGLDLFTYRASAGGLQSNVAVVAISVNPPPDAFRISHMGPDGNPDFRANDPALAYNPARNEFLTVWSADHNQGTADNEFEIWGQRLDAATVAAVGPQFRISDMGPEGDDRFDASNPAVVFNSVRNEYLVVWQSDDNTGSLVDHELEIFGQRLDALGNEIGVDDFRISDMGKDGDWTYMGLTPAVAHNPARDEYLVVWMGDDNTGRLVDNEFEILGQRLSGGGVEIGTNDFPISRMGPDGDTAYNAGSPDIVFNPVRDEYFVVWSGDTSSGTLVDGEFEIFGQRLGPEGTAVGVSPIRISDMGPDGDTKYGAGTPVVAHQADLDWYYVAWSGDDDTGTLVDDELEIFGQVLWGDGTRVAENATAGDNHRISYTGPDGDTSYTARRPAVAYNLGSNQYLVTWRGVASAPTATDAEHEIFASVLLPSGSSVGLRNRQLSHMGPDGDVTYAADTPAVVGYPEGNQWLVAWSGDLGFPPLVADEFEVLGYRQPGGKPYNFSAMNRAPLAENDSLTVGEGGSGTFDLLENDSDPDGADLTAPVIVTLPQHGSVAVKSPDAVIYTHDGSETATDSFSYQTSDGELISNVALVDVAIERVNEPPVAQDDLAYVPWGGTVEIDVLANDTDVDDEFLIPTITAQPSHGSAIETGSTIRYTHDGSETKSDSLMYWVGDGWSVSNEATVTISIGEPLSHINDWVGLVQPNGRWHLYDLDGNETVFFYGMQGDVALLGDWDGDGQDTPGMFRPANGFAYLTNTLPPDGGVGVGDPELTFFFGVKGDQVIVGDWNGDGKDTLGIRRGGKMYLTNVNATSVAEHEFFFGVGGDYAIGGDPDGDGKDNVFLYRPSSGYVYYTMATPANGAVAATFDTLYFGVPSDRMIIGDWDEDGVDTVGIYRPGDTTFHLANSLSDASKHGDPVAADMSMEMGSPEWWPVAGAW